MSTPPLIFRFPNGANQGRDRWYAVAGTIRLHLPSVDDRAVGGRNYVSVHVNGYAAIQVKVVPLVAGGAIGVRWEMYDLIEGKTEGVTFDSEIRLPVRNYLQISSVQEGESSLQVRLEQPKGVVVSAVELEGGSAIRATSVGPNETEMGIPGGVVYVRQGQVFEVPVQLQTRGTPARGVVVSALWDEGSFGASRPTTFHWSRLNGSSRMLFGFVGFAPGSHELLIAVRIGNGGTWVEELAVTVMD